MFHSSTILSEDVFRNLIAGRIVGGEKEVIHYCPMAVSHWNRLRNAFKTRDVFQALPVSRNNCLRSSGPEPPRFLDRSVLSKPKSVTGIDRVLVLILL